MKQWDGNAEGQGKRRIKMLPVGIENFEEIRTEDYYYVDKTGMNNPKVLSITSVRFDEYFGFTDSEVREMLSYYDLGNKYDMIKEWYDGYHFGNAGLYCPWDVISYCDELLDDPQTEPKDYWSNTSSNDVVKRFLQMAKADTRDDIERLIAGETVLKTINEELTSTGSNRA